MTRLTLRDGRRVWLEFHSYLGPAFFRDRAGRREIEEWYTDQTLCDAFDWWMRRGKKG